MAVIYRTKSTRQRRNKDGSPAPQPRCEVCTKRIEVGMPHKNVSTRSGSMFITRIRCADEADWQPWELSSSLSARLQEVSHNFWSTVHDAESLDDVSEALNDAAASVREIAEEKRESAQNIEDGFQHPTYQSDELNETADALESWADEIESADVPEFPEAEEQDCEECDADGRVDGVECQTCEGNGQTTPDKPTEDQVDEWRGEVESALTIVNESPV